MKILFVNEKCGYFGGVEQNIADAAQGLVSRGHLCYIAYGEITDRPGKESYMSRFEECLPCVDFGAGAQGYSFEEIVARIAPDVVFFHKVAELRPFLPHLSRARSVRMIHDHEPCCPTGFKYFRHNGHICQHKAGWRCWLDGGFVARKKESRFGFGLVNLARKFKQMRLNNRFDALLAGSRFMRDELIQNGFPADKVRILPPMVQSAQDRFLPLPTEPNILCVGQLIRGKGVDLLLQALSKVSCAFHATIAGTGNAQGKLETLSNCLGLNDKVTFQGWVDPADIGALYASARIVVVPSRWPEPFGMVGLEAMHYGRPVVAFAVGGIPDWLAHEETGLLVPERDVADFARAIERLLKHADLTARLGENACRRVQERFAFERYLDQLEVHLCGDQARMHSKFPITERDE